jgi:hypothetical protein
MVSGKPAEALHTYLRRYLEKVSQGMARQFAEQRNDPKLEAFLDRLFSEGSQS